MLRSCTTKFQPVVFISTGILKKYYIYDFNPYLHRWESNFWHVPAKVIGCVTVYMTSSKRAWLGGEILMFIFSSLVFFEPDGSSLWWSRTRCLTLSAIPKLPESPVERIPPTVTQHLKRNAHVTECLFYTYLISRSVTICKRWALNASLLKKLLPRSRYHLSKKVFY